MRRIVTRAQYLSFAATSVQGECDVLVRSNMSDAAVSYSSHFSRLRQSSAVILKRLKRVCSRASKRRFCSSREMWSQNLQTIVPFRVSCYSKSLISA